MERRAAQPTSSVRSVSLLSAVSMAVLAPSTLANWLTSANQIDFLQKTRKLFSTHGCTATTKSLLPAPARKDCQ